MRFFSYLFPHIYVKNIKVIPYEKLKKKGIVNLIFDIDNTLVPHDMPQPPQEIADFLKELKNRGFNLCFLSNNTEKRVRTFNEELNITAIAKARKPGLKGLNRGLDLIGATYQNTAIIGDQIFTDIWAGKRKGLVTILTKPVVPGDEFFVWIKRGVEQLIVKEFIRQSKRDLY